MTPEELEKSRRRFRALAWRKRRELMKRAARSHSFPYRNLLRARHKMTEPELDALLWLMRTRAQSSFLDSLLAQAVRSLRLWPMPYGKPLSPAQFAAVIKQAP